MGRTAFSGSSHFVLNALMVFNLVLVLEGGFLVAC